MKDRPVPRWRAAAICIALAFSLAGCANGPTISAAPANPVAEVLAAVAPAQLVKDAQDTVWNLDQAQTIGVLAANDPGPACGHEILGLAGIPALDASGNPVVPPAAPITSFQAKVTGIFSAGSVAYIAYIQGQAATQSPAQIPTDCQTVWGRLNLLGLQSAAKGLSFGLAPTIVK